MISADLPWDDVEVQLNQFGYASLGQLIGEDMRRTLIEQYQDRDAFRSHIDMARYNFGSGEYKYYRYPLPDMISDLRSKLYPHLSEIANRWAERLDLEVRYPANHGEFLAQCHASGQVRPTPLILSYGKGDYNCLHQDLYGEVHFPLQMVVLLSQPGVDFEGGEFVLTEQRPRMQSRVHVVPIKAGEAIVFGVNERPAQGRLRPYRVKMRHGVSLVRRGNRFALGCIFHDAT